MSKNRKHAHKQPNALPHSQPVTPLPPVTSLPADTGHVVYPELIKQQSRLESLGRTFRSFVPSFSPSSFSNQSSPTPAAVRNTYGSYASTPVSEQVPEESKLDNAVAWSQWASFNNRTTLLVAYRLSGFHIWDVSSLDAVKEKLYLPSTGPVIAACLLPEIDASSSRLLMLVGSRDDTTLVVYSLETNTVTTRLSVPNARRLQANSRFICIGTHSISTDLSSDSVVYILSTKSDYPLLHTIPAASLPPSDPVPIFALSNTRLLAYASAPPPTHRQQSPPTSSYPPSNPFATPSSIPSSTSPIASGLATGMAVVGSGMLSGAKILGTGVLEGVKMGINAAGYRTATSGTGQSEGLSPEKGSMFSRSAPTGQPSPISSHGHSRRASGNINARPAVPGVGLVPGSATGSNDGSWVTILDLQPLLTGPSTGPAHDTQEAEEFVRSPRSSSFHANIPPLRNLSTPSSTKQPVVLAESQYSSPSTSSIPSLRTLGRYSPGSGSGTPTLAPLAKALPELITQLKWNPDGSMLAVGGNEGGSVKVFKVARIPNSRKQRSPIAKDDTTKNEDEKGAKVGLTFEMLRGVSPASIAGIEWSESGLWSGFVSGNGTLHMFAVSPDGGAIDEISHLTGKTRNTAPRRLTDASIRLSAIARLRKPFLSKADDAGGSSLPPPANRRISDSNLPSLDELSATLSMPFSITAPSFTFIPNPHSLSSKRLPIPRDGSSRPITPADPSLVDNGHDQPAGGFQDVLIFDPDESALLVWRCTLHSSKSAAPSAHTSGRPSMERATSVVGDAGPDANADVATKASGVGSLPIGGVLSGVARMAGLSRVRESGLMSALGSVGLSGEGSVIASWNLKRDDAWAEVKDSLLSEGKTGELDSTKTPYLSHSELTTFPTRSSYIKRPVYLSRQFNFAALMSDYHALLRRLDFDPPNVPIVVRKDGVIVRSGDDLHDAGTSLPSDFDSQADFLGTAAPLDLTESPLLGGHLGLVPDHAPFSSSLASTSTTSFSSPSRGARKTIRHSFDDSISSAIGSNLQLDASYSPSGSSSDIASPGHVIPMYPNGRPGNVGGLDAVVRGTARVGKEVWSGFTNARSPLLLPTKRTSATGEMLKLNEEEEMFMVDDLDGAGVEDNGLPANPAKKEASEATINPLSWSIESGSIYPRMTDSGMTIGPSGKASGTTNEDGTWVAQPEVYNQAVEEDTKYDDVTRILDEEREERKKLQAKMGDGGKAVESTKSKSKKGSSRRKKKGGS